MTGLLFAAGKPAEAENNKQAGRVLTLCPLLSKEVSILAIGLILVNWVWQLFKNYFAGAGIEEAEDPLKLSIRTFIFLFLTFYQAKTPAVTTRQG